MTQGLTPIQAEVLGYLRARPDTPSFREIADGCHIAISGVHRVIVALEERGFIARVPGRARAARIVEPLEHVAADRLIAELERRGWTVTAPGGLL